MSRQEGMSPGLKPAFSPSCDARTKVRAYLSSKSIGPISAAKASGPISEAKTTAVPIRQTLPREPPARGDQGCRRFCLWRGLRGLHGAVAGSCSSSVRTALGTHGGVVDLRFANGGGRVINDDPGGAIGGRDPGSSGGGSG